jgi:hypothetical protein
MKIVSDHLSETILIDTPQYKDMRRALQLFTAKRISVMPTKFVMEGGN